MNNSDQRLFLYDTVVDLVLTTNSMYVDNRPMNNRRLQAHKGTNNEIFFNIRNRDRKLQNVFNDELVAYIVNPQTKRRLLTKRLTVTDKVGIVKLILAKGDLQNINAGLYRVYITRSTSNQEDLPVYSTQNNDMSLDIEISNEAFVEATPTQISTALTETSSNVFVTSSFNGNQDRNFQNAQHSIAIYTTSYTGNLTVQASCLEGVPENDDTSPDWFSVAEIELDDYSGITHRTFVVNANWVRVVSKPADSNSSVTQVVLRN